MNMKINVKFAIHVFALATVVLWALANVLTRIAVTYFSPESISFLRCLIAAITLVVYAFVKKMRPPSLNDVPLFFFGGAIGFALFVHVFNVGSKTVTASVISFILNATPVITAVLARIILKERIGTVGWLCVIGAFTGVGIITVANSDFAVEPGILWICLSSVLMSSYNIFQRKLLLKYGPLEITTYCLISGAILLSVFAPQAIFQLTHAPASQVITIVILGVFPSAIAYLCWAYALSKAEKTSDVINYMFLIPIITTFLGCIIINEFPHLSTYLGGSLVIISALLLNMRHIFQK